MHSTDVNYKVLIVESGVHIIYRTFTGTHKNIWQQNSVRRIITGSAF